MRRKRRPWTAKDDELITKFNAEGKCDTIIAYIIDRQRADVRKHRLKLGLPARKRPANKGWKHSIEARRKLSASNRRRWQDPAFAEREAERLRALARGRPKTRPARGSDDHKLYCKFIRTLGLERARQEMGL